MRVFGVLGGVLLFAFGLLHSLAGWPALVTELNEFNVPEDVIAGLTMPWHFTGLGMVVFGVMSMHAAMSVPTKAAASSSLIIGGTCFLFAVVTSFFVPVVPLVVYGLPGALIATAGVMATRSVAKRSAVS